MRLFSTRYEKRRFAYYPGSDSDDTNDSDVAIFNDALRTKLMSEVKFISSNKSFLESFILVNNEIDNSVYLNSKTISDITKLWAGYDISNTFDFKKSIVSKINDAHLLDLLEILVIFCIDSKRSNLISRLNVHFKEAGVSYYVHEGLILEKRESGVWDQMHLMNDDRLREMLIKINRSRRVVPDYTLLAKKTSEVVQYLFSSDVSQDKTKDAANSLCVDIATALTDETGVQTLSELISKTVLDSKNLSNKIADIRHSDKHTITTEAPSLYKLVFTKNLAIIELVILSLPERFIHKNNPNEIKNKYLVDYSINKDAVWSVKKPILVEVDPDDIPF